jgi:hypothetical protein
MLLNAIVATSITKREAHILLRILKIVCFFVKIVCIDDDRLQIAKPYM